MSVHPSKLIKQLFYHSHLPLGLNEDFLNERDFFWSEIIQMLTHKDIVYNAGIAGSNIKQVIVKFKNVYGLRRNEQQLLISLLLEMLFTRRNVRTDSKILLLNFLNEMLSTKDDFPDFKLDWTVFYQFYQQEFHNNEEKPFRNEQQNMGLFSEFIDLVKRCKKYFDASSIPQVYEVFKQNYYPCRADHAMNFLTLFLKVDTDAAKPVYEELLRDLIQFLNYSYCSRNTLTLFNIMKILRQFKDLSWSKYYDEIFTCIFRNLNNLLILDTVSSEENVINTMLPEEPIGVKSILKQIPDLMVHLLLPSSHSQYEIVWQYIERVFLLIDRVFNPNNKSDQCDALLKLIKVFVRKFIVRFDQEQRDKFNLADPSVAEENDDQDDVLDLEYNVSEYNIPDYAQEIYRNKGTGKREFHPEYVLDDVCKERFLGLMDKFLKKLVYMEDSSHSSCKIMLWLSYFDPARYVVPIIEHCIASFEFIDNMALGTVKGIVLFILPLLCDRKLCPTGLKYIPQFLKVSFKLFEIQGIKDNLDLIESYSKLFMVVPIQRYQDLVSSYLLENPEKGERGLQELLSFEEQNLGGLDTVEFIQQLEVFAVKFFKVLVDNITTIDMAESESSTLIIDFNNVFWSFIVNSSHSLRITYLDLLFSKLGDNIMPEAQQAISYLLDCFSLTEPEAVMERTIQLIETRLLKKRNDESVCESNMGDSNSKEKMKANVMWYFLEQNPHKERILAHEFALFSTTSIKYFVSILENSMSYANEYIIKHIDVIETVAFLCFFQDDLTVFEKSCDIIHTVILTLSFVYPKEVGYLNPKEKTSNSNSDHKYTYLTRLAKTDLKKFEIDWFTNSPQAKSIILRWLDISLFSVFKFFSDNYFSDSQKYPQLDYQTDYMTIIDGMLFDSDSETALQASRLSKDFYKILYVVLASFSGINVRVPFIKLPSTNTSRQQRYSDIYENFQGKFMFNELADTREQLTTLCVKLPSLFHHTKTITDSSLIEVFQCICREVFGESYLIDEIKRSNDMLDGLCTLNDFHRPNLFANRFSLASECATYLNEKIDLFFFLNPYLGSQKIQLFNSFFILSFHPTYLFRMAVRFDHDLSLAVNQPNPYDDMHKKAFAIMNNYIYNQKIFKQEMTPIIEKVQELLLSNLRIESLQRFPCCASNPEAFIYMFNSVEVFEQMDKKVWQQKVVEQIQKALTITYEDSYLFEQLRKDVKRAILSSPVVKSCEGYETFKANIQIFRQSISLERALEVREAFVQIIKKANDKLEDEKAHWKTKVLCGLFVVYFLNVFDDLNNHEIVRFAKISIQFAADNKDVHLAQFGRSILFRLLNLRKRRVVKKSTKPEPGCHGPKEFIENQMEEEHKDEGEYTLDQFLTYHFLKKSDLTSFLIKNREIGTYYEYAQLYNKHGYAFEENEGLFSQTLKDFLLNPTFFSGMVESIFDAKEIYASDSDEFETEQLQVDLGQGEVFEQVQILFNFTFDSDKKKVTLFNANLNFNLFEFYARLFKKIFQCLGSSFFQISQEKIFSLLGDYTSLTKQRVVSIYVWAVLKWLMRVPRKDRVPYMDFCVEIASKCMVNCSLELFRDWSLSISQASKNNSYEIVEEFCSRLLEVLKAERGLGKRFRYHKLLKIMLSMNCCWARKYALQGLEMIIEKEVEDIKECDEHTELFAEILCSGIVNRINTKKVLSEKWVQGGIEKHLEKNLFITSGEYTMFENNPLVGKYIAQIFERLQYYTVQKNDQKKKLYSHLAFKVLDSISVKRLNDLLWSIFRPFFVYILDNKPDNVNEVEILKVLACNEYPENIAQDIKSILATKIESENWVSRQKVLLFCENFLYFEMYSKNAVKVDPLLLKGLSDKNNSVSLLAVQSLCEVVKIATSQEQQTIFSIYRASASTLLPKDKTSSEYKQILESKQIAVLVLMAMLLAFQEEILPWTEDALKEVIASKSLSPNMKKKVKEFVGKFWRDQNEVISFNSLSLSEKVKKQIREIANPYDYFA